MLPRVTGVRHLKQFELELHFADGTVATLDFTSRVRGRGGVFVPMQDAGFFAQVKLDEKAGTICWPNGVDFCPDVLYSEATGKPLPDANASADVA